MNKRKIGFDETLGQHVVSSNRCVGCATCVVVCPFNCLAYEGGQPELVKDCEECGICPRVCPKNDWSWSETEQFVFGRSREADEGFGVNRRLILAQASDEKIRKNGQDGGFVTALLIHSLNEGIIEGAAVAGHAGEKPFYPSPLLATTPEQLLRSAGTRYTYSPNMLALKEGITEKKRSLAFVGTPCQIHAIRKIQMFPLKKYATPLQYNVGLMCTESFTYTGLLEEELGRNLNVQLQKIVKMNIKGKILIDLKSGATEEISLSDVKKYVRPSCHNCSDFSAELADISAGGLGLNGWTFVVVRTEKGEDVFNSALEAGVLITRPVEEAPFALKLLSKLTKKKLKNSPR